MCLRVCYECILSYSTVVLYIRFGASCPKIPPRNLPNIYFLIAWQHWLGIAKPINVFRSTLNLCIKLLWNFKNFLFNRFFYWLTDWLTIWLMPSGKRNSITATTMGSISSLFNVASSWDVPFRQLLQLQCSYHGSIKTYLCSPFLSPLPRRWRFVVAPLRGFMEDLVTAVIAEVFNTLSLIRSVNC